MDWLARERKVRLLLEYQFDFMIFLFVSIVYPALCHRVPSCQWMLSVSVPSGSLMAGHRVVLAVGFL